MTDQQETNQETPEPVVYRYTGPRNALGQPQQFLPGVPARDLTDADIARLTDRQAGDLGLLYAAAGDEGDQEQHDPLGELTNEEYDALTPAEKGGRTRRANEQKRDEEAGDDGDDTTDGESAES